ncbi:MAG TPA: protein kinase [Ilumatobacter sp.]|nr:protein kinase [Ilumatobacter sp.]
MATSAAPPPPAPSGVLIARRYLLDRRIGRGGMAEVWSATDTELDRKVAVKWLRSNLAGDPVVAERFRREATAVARLSHPNIVAIHDVCEHDGRQAVVMQLVDGKSLRTLLDGQKRLGPELTIHIGAAIASALHEAHRGGFVHRDVKPGNILVTGDGRVLLTDFGIAKGLDPGEDDLTSDNVMMGTAKYLSPEQVRGKRLDGRADIYALGLVLYECLAGRVPFLGESDADTALARLQRDPTDLGHLRPTLPIGLVNLIHRTLARNPHHRPQTGNDLRAALLAVDTSPPVIDGTPAELPPRLAQPPRAARGAGPGKPGAVRPTPPSSGSSPNPSTGPSPGTSPTPIPGEPHVTGRQPVVTAGGNRPAPRPARTEPRPRPHDQLIDDTPATTGPIVGTPARRDTQRPQVAGGVIAGLLALALIVAAVLFVVLKAGRTQPDEPSVTVAPDQPVATAPNLEPASPVVTVAPAPDSGPPGIDGARAWDPYGDNQTENDSQAVRAVDGDPDTAWATECYQDKYMGSKQGVGLVVDLTTPGSGTIAVQIASAPYQVSVWATDAAQAPADPAAWTPVGAPASSDSPGTVERQIELAATHVLVWFTELGHDAACSSSNPYRGLVAEVAFSG